MFTHLSRWLLWFAPLFITVECIWFDYNPLDGNVESLNRPSNITLVSDRDRLHEKIYQEPKRVRYDDGWIAVHPPMRPTNPPTLHPTMQPTLKPSKHPTAKPTLAPTTPLPTESPTEKWWSPAKSSTKHKKSPSAKQKQKSDASQVIKDDQLLSKIARTSNVINIYTVNTKEQELLNKHIKVPDLLLIQLLTPVEITLTSLMKIIQRAVFDPISINFSFLYDFVRKCVWRMNEYESTRIVFNETMDALQIEYKYLKNQASKSGFDLLLSSDKDIDVEQHHKSETAFVWFHFISIAMQKLSDRVCDSVIATMQCEGGKCIKNDKFSFEMMISIVNFFKTKIKQRVEEAICEIMAVSLKQNDGFDKLKKICSELFIEAFDLINMRSEILALLKIYIWRFEEGNNGNIHFVTLKIHYFIPFALRMGYDEKSIHLYEVYRKYYKMQNGRNKNRQSKVSPFEITELAINYSLPYVKDLAGLNNKFNKESLSKSWKGKKHKVKAAKSVNNNSSIVNTKDMVNIYSGKYIKDHLNIFENELIAEEKSDLVIITGLNGYGVEGLLPAVCALKHERYLGVYYNDLGAIYDQLIQFISIIEQGYASVMYPEHIGRIIHLMKNIKERPLFQIIFAVLKKTNKEMDVGYHLVLECIRRYYDGVKLSKWSGPLKLIKNKFTIKVILDFWLNALFAVLDMKREEWQTEIVHYDYMKSGQVPSEIFQWPNIASRTLEKIVELAPELVYTSGNDTGSVTPFAIVCRMLMHACLVPITTTNAIEIVDILYRWRKQKQLTETKGITISIVVWEHDDVIDKLLNALGYANESIVKYDIQYLAPKVGECIQNKYLKDSNVNFFRHPLKKDARPIRILPVD